MTDLAEKGLLAGEASGDGMPLRLAIVGSPRSGNSWLRHMLRDLFGLEERSSFTAAHEGWQDIPDRCVFQVHEYPNESFLRRLEEYGFRVLTPVRHPFDVLMSWLNYLFFAHQDNRCWRCWEPEGCKERPIIGVSPRSREFLDYATGPHARSLLNFGPAWWERPGVIRVRYEDLVVDPIAHLSRIAREPGEPFRRPPEEVVEATAIARRKSGDDFWQYHYWQGQPGLWRAMLPAVEARAIAANLPEALEALGFACDPDESLGPLEADLNWFRLQNDSLREYLTLEKSKHREKIRSLTAVSAERNDLGRSLAEERRSHEVALSGLDELRRRLEDERRALVESRQALRLAEIRILSASERSVHASSIGPRLLKYARRVQEFATRGRAKGPHTAVSRWLEPRWE